MIRRLLARWATAALQEQVRDLQSQIEQRDRTIGVMQAEIDAMAAVIARDRERIRAEGAAYARQRAEAEGVISERDFESSGRR